MDCGVCAESVAKYKCPTCRIPYCSVRCCKQHKESKCSAPESEVHDEVKQDSRLSSYQYPTEDTVSLDKLKMLENHKGLKVCLENPHLRKILTSLDQCDNPDGMIAKFMQEPIFTEFVDECLKVVEPSEEINDPLAELFPDTV